MKRLLIAPLLFGLTSPVLSHTIAEYNKINPLPNSAVLYPFEKIEDASNWRNYCISTTAEMNKWMESYIEWAGKKLRKERNIYVAKGFTDKAKEVYLRKNIGCDCIVEKRIIALDTLSKKAADALVDSQEAQCFNNL